MTVARWQLQWQGLGISYGHNVTTAVVTVDKQQLQQLNCNDKRVIAVAAARAQLQSQLLQLQWTKSNCSGKTTTTTTIGMQQLPIQTNQAVGCYAMVSVPMTLREMK